MAIFNIKVLHDSNKWLIKLAGTVSEFLTEISFFYSTSLPYSVDERVNSLHSFFGYENFKIC